jgi:Uma2 family endonuclease
MMTSPREYREVVLELLPQQGNLSEEDYLWLTDHTNRLIEFTDGYIEVLPMPTDEHQSILDWLVTAFKDFILPRGGKVLFAPLRLRLPDGKIREPDLLLLRDARDPRRRNRYWTGADLVLEVVSADKPERDLVEKRREYAQAGIPEYWIVNPLDRSITVLALDARGEYAERGVFTPGIMATSALFPDFSMEVAQVFDADVPPDEDDDE